VGPPRAPSRTRPGHGAGRGVDVRAAVGRAQRRADHPRPERCRGAVPVCGGPSPEPAPHGCWVDAADGGGDPGEPPVYGSRHPAHAALVSEADFIAAQDTAAPRGPAGPAARRYLLAGLLACGRCGRRLEPSWSNGKPAYRCRHGYTSATRPRPGRPGNTYVREEQILPHMAAIAVLLAGSAGESGCGNRSPAQLTRPGRYGSPDRPAPRRRRRPDLRTRTFSMLDAAYAAGVRYVDAARSYGRAEEFLAGWLAERGHADVIVGSK
jgi:Recombinase zinc beta ribbon domain